MAQTEHLLDWSWTNYNPVCCGWETCDPGHSFGPAVREFYTIHYVLSGTGTFVVKGKEYHLKAGDLFAFSPYETCFYKASDADPWHYVWINFVINGQVPYFFENPVTHAPFLKPIFERLQGFSDYENNGRSFVTTCLWEIANQLSSQQSETKLLVERAMQHIHQHYSNANLSITEIADKLHVSRYTLSAAFSLEKSIGPMEYLVRFRLEKACEYMTTQKLPPSVVSNSVGYRNYSNFSNMFKKYYGMSPKEYQKKMSGTAE